MPVRIRVALLVSLFFPPPSTAASAQAARSLHTDSSAIGRMRRLADRFVMVRLEAEPEQGQLLGIEGTPSDRLGDRSPDAVGRSQAVYDSLRRALEGIAVDSLRDRPEFALYGVLSEALAQERAARVCRRELWNVGPQHSSLYPTLVALATEQPVGTSEHRTAALRRWGAVPGWIDGEIERLKRGLSTGYVASRSSVERGLDEIRQALAAGPERSPLRSPAERDTTPDFDRAFDSVLTRGVTPALARYRDFLEREYLPRARPGSPLALLPDGPTCYRALVRSMASLDMAPRSLHELGLKELETIEARMAEIAARSFGGVPVDSAVRSVLAPATAAPRDTTRTLDAARREVERARRALSAWFGFVPNAPLNVRPVPPDAESGSPGGVYLAGSVEHPATFLVNTRMYARRGLATLTVLGFHEAIPGHHLQHSVAQALPEPHPAAKFVGSLGFTEGWALYAEGLAEEMGLVTSDTVRLALLNSRRLRAARLALDPALHTLGWDRERGVAFLLAHGAITPAEAAQEVDRYILLPGQGTAYLLGCLEIERIKARVQHRLKDRFDIRKFHDAVLGQGTIPLSLLAVRFADEM